MEPEPDSPDLFFSSILLLLPLVALNTVTIVLIFVLILLIFCSAVISSSEVAYFSLGPAEIKTLRSEESNKSSQRILSFIANEKAKDRPKILLATILISNNLINVAIILVSENLVNKFFSDSFFTNAGASLSAIPLLDNISVETWANVVDILITVGLVTFILVLFGEVMPKVYAKLNNLSIAKKTSGVLNVLMSLFYPLSGLLVNGTDFIENRLLAKTNNSSTSMEEFDEAISLAVGDEKHAEEDKGILKGIIKFGDVPVKQVMKSRVDVVAVDFKDKYTDLLKIINDSGYSRIPVIDEEFDNVTGILYVKDLLGHLEKGNEFEWQELIRTTVFYVPEAKKLDDLLKEFQSQKQHMAVVVDEYGGSAGIVTLEDVLEEIIGDIKDEFDQDSEVEYRKIDDQNYIFEGKTLLNDVFRIIGAPSEMFDEIRGDSDSLAGLVLELVGFIPKSGEVFEFSGYNFKIVTVNKKRIEQILITLPVES